MDVSVVVGNDNDVVIVATLRLPSHSTLLYSAAVDAATDNPPRQFVKPLLEEFMNYQAQMYRNEAA